jgi:hypothetical protein
VYRRKIVHFKSLETRPARSLAIARL